MLIHAYVVCVAAVLAMAVRVNGEESIVVNWTVAGVQNYGEPRYAESNHTSVGADPWGWIGWLATPFTSSSNI